MKTSMAVRLGMTIAALLVAGSTINAHAQAGGPGFGEHRAPFERALGPQGRGGRWWNEQALIEKLKLTEDQRKAMDQILLEHREKLIDLRAAVEKAEVGMQPMMRDDQPNEAKILAQIDRLAQARAELEKGNARFLLALRAKLTPEQWKTLRALREEHREWRQPPPPRHGQQGPGQQGPGQQGPPPQGPGLDGPDGPGAQSHLDQDSGPGGPDGADAGDSPDVPAAGAPGATATK
jgi:periplasmic protein CpxP/Spy